MRSRSILILASASPHRLELLKQVNITPDQVIPADIDESVQKNELPKNYALRMAKEKAVAVRNRLRDSDLSILSADTVVACGRRILPKAETIEQAQVCLSLLSGRRHRVYGGIAFIDPNGELETCICQTVVQFKRLSDEEIRFYLDSGEWSGKAGGYAIQGYAAGFVKFISGSYSNVVGLSLYDTLKLLNNS